MATFGNKASSSEAILKEMKKIRVEILVEEPSMENFLISLLPLILPEGFEIGINVFVRPHEGKSDLQKSIPKKVRAYRYYPEEVLVVVIHDQDQSDCKYLKSHIAELIRKADSRAKFLIRIACRELENWYLGDLEAVEKLYPKSKARSLSNKSRYQNTDNLFGSKEMLKLTSRFSKGKCAKTIVSYMSLDSNRSTSFKHFINGLQRFLKS